MAAPASPGSQLSAANRPLSAEWLGRVPYRQAWDLQRRVGAERLAGAREDTLLLLEHPPVLTLGRRASLTNVLAPPEALQRRGIEVVPIDRGGDVTYHGPGQLVAYPIFRLEGSERDLPRFFWKLEESVIRYLAALGLAARRDPSMRGVWVGPAKVCAMGIAVKRWVTYHGLALNVTTDLRDFQLINPCGVPHAPVTSLERELARPLALPTAARAFAAYFAEVFERNLAWAG